MRIGILETGAVEKKFKSTHKTYGFMFKKLFNRILDQPSFKIIKLLEGEFPEKPKNVDLWVVTGSSYGVYDKLSWIPSLKNFINKCLDQQVPIFGVCFGHQLLAEALGGTVEKFKGGWVLGVNEYNIVKNFKWNQEMQKSFSGYAFHQDQVIIAPKSSKLIATSTYCSNAVLSYGDIDKPTAISVQSHPEFHSSYVRDLLNARKGSVYPIKLAEEALNSLSEKVDGQTLTRIIVRALIK